MQTYALNADYVAVADDAAESVEMAACRIAGLLRRRLGRQDVVNVALSGGNTPRPLYRRLAGAPYRHLIDWSRVRLFWCDERCVGPDHPASNFRLVRETLLGDLPRMPDVYRMKGERRPELAAHAYACTLDEAMGGPQPWFDLVVLGVGDDGHVASLFPDSPQLASSRAVVATHSPKPPHPRISLGLRALNAADEVLFLVHGPEKADIVSAVLADPDGEASRAYPAARVRPQGRVSWYLDRQAASRLPS